MFNLYLLIFLALISSDGIITIDNESFNYADISSNLYDISIGKDQGIFYEFFDITYILKDRLGSNVPHPTVTVFEVTLVFPDEEKTIKIPFPQDGKFLDKDYSTMEIVESGNIKAGVWAKKDSLVLLRSVSSLTTSDLETKEVDSADITITRYDYSLPVYLGVVIAIGISAFLIIFKLKQRF